VLIQKSEEIALKLNIEFTPLNGWLETYALKGESCHVGKRGKDGGMVLVCVNMDGSENLPFLVSGK
jgi:hypothetical protein